MPGKTARKRARRVAEGDEAGLGKGLKIPLVEAGIVMTGWRMSESAFYWTLAQHVK